MAQRPPKHRFDRSRQETRQSSPQSDGIWLWGIHPVLAALKNPHRKCLRFVLTSETHRHHEERIKSLLISRGGLYPEILDRQDFETILSPGSLHQGIALQVDSLPEIDIESFVESHKDCDQGVIIILDQVSDPHNVGAILRSAAAFSALAVIVQDRHSPQETGVLAKSASGALEVMPLIRVTNIVRTLEFLKKMGFWSVGLAGDSSMTLASASLSGRVALIVGNEGEGLRRLTRDHCDYLVKLPQSQLVESLNVSNATAIALYELTRS